MNWENIPGELRSVKQWVIWNVPGAKKVKEPFNPKKGAAKANDAGTWGGFDEALQAVEQGRGGGIGFMFAGGYAGIDLDHVIDEAGKLKDFARDIVQTMDSYTELSPSGTGLHILFRLNMPLSGIGGRNRDSELGLEIYDNGRYFTVTGNVYGKPKPIADRTAELKQIYARYLVHEEKKAKTNTVTRDLPLQKSISDLSDSDLWDVMLKSKHSYTIQALLNGDISVSDNDHSKADMTLCRHLAFYTDKDAARMDRMFRETGLMRDKWDEIHGSQTYGEMTIQQAIEYCNDGYTPQYRDENTRPTPNSRKQSSMTQSPQRNTQDNTQEDTPEDLEKETVAARLDNFLGHLKHFREGGKAISTGFQGLDTLLDGGLYPGLYIVGAISSLGKTTFCTQIADQIAMVKGKEAQSVLIFSLEMSAYEIMSKSLSRLTALNGMKEYGNLKYSLSTRDILRCEFVNEQGSFDSTAREQIWRLAFDEYDSYARKIYITEGIGNVGVETVKNKIEQYMNTHTTPPVILIDYLQILAPYSEKLTDKQNVDKNVLELKRLSRDFKIPVIGISSFNRENYNSPVSMASFKESGAIEYSSDVLIGLQYEGWDYQEDESKEKRTQRIHARLKEIHERIRQGDPAPIQAKILKNRNGQKGSMNMDFYPKFNYFEERVNHG